MQLWRGHFPTDAGKCRQRYHLPQRIAHFPLAYVFRLHAIRGIGLYVHALHPPIVDEVVDVIAAQGVGQQAVHIGCVDLLCHGFFIVYADVQLGAVILVGGARIV